VSAACPRVKSVASDRPRPSARVAIFVVNPPRDRPMPSRAGVWRTLSPFNGISHVPSAATGGTADTVCSTADSVQAGPAMVSRCA
jgi:hypothetical protein